MKIALVYGFFLPVPPALGGATEKIWFNIGRRLADRGHEVTAFTRTWPDFPDRETIDGVHYYRVPGWDHTQQLWRNLILDFRWGLRIRRVLPRDAVVISHNVNLPYLLRPPFGRHPMPVSVVIGRMPKGQVRAYGGVDRIYATSTAVANQARRENPGADGQIKNLRNCVDWHAFQSGDANQTQPPVRIGFVGRIHPEKGLDMLIDAAAIMKQDASLPAWEVSMVGPVEPTSGGGGREFQASLQQRIDQHGLTDQVIFKDPIWDPAVLVKHYQGLSIFCYPTRAEKGEGLSVAPIEAMAAGAIPVLTRLECYDDLIEENKDGILFNHRSATAPADLAAAFTKVIRDHEFRDRVSAAAREKAHAFDYDSVTDDLIDDLTQLLTPGTSPSP